MRQFVAFTKKEFLETIRNGKMVIIIAVFCLFGIMSPGVAKLTPWLMEQFSSSLGEAGFAVTQVEVTALSSWAQHYKNIPMGLIIFLLMFSGILANELQKGTLINMITKGLSRSCVVITKNAVLFVLWTVSYWLCFGITYVYSEYFWDNRIADHLFYAAFATYIFGIWMCSLLILMSAISSTSSTVTVLTGVVFIISYVLGIVPDLKRVLPTTLMSAGELLIGEGKVGDYNICLCVVVILTLIQYVVAVQVFKKRRL